MVIVFCPAQPLPLLSASKITHQPRVEVANAPPGMPEWVFAEVAPQIEVDPLKVVCRVVWNEHNRASRSQPFPELTEGVLRAVDTMKCLHTPFPKRVDIDCAELRHVTDGGRSNPEGRFAVNNDQSTYWWTPDVSGL
jgi:hypothetical protein